MGAATSRRMKSSITFAALSCLVAGGQVHGQLRTKRGSRWPHREIRRREWRANTLLRLRTRRADRACARRHRSGGRARHGQFLVAEHTGPRDDISSVLALNRLGQGMTANPKDDNDFGMEGDVEHLYQFILTLKLERVHLVGHSFEWARGWSMRVETSRRREKRDLDRRWRRMAGNRAQTSRAPSHCEMWRSDERRLPPMPASGFVSTRGVWLRLLEGRRLDRDAAQSG